VERPLATAARASAFFFHLVQGEVMSEPADRNGHLRLNRRQLLFSSGVVALSGLAAACSTGGSTSSATGGSASGGTSAFRYAEAGALTTLNPWDRTVVAEDFFNQVFSRLVYLDYSGEPVADLAQSWKVATDSESIELTLRPGATWHDGTKVTAQDFVRMYGYLTDPALKSYTGAEIMAGLFTPVSSVTAPDASTVRIEFSQPVPYVMTLLSYWYLVNIDDTSDPDFMKHLPVGTGPFKMTSFNAESGAELAAFPGYYGPKPGVKTLQFDTFGGSASMVSDLKSGLVDGVLVNNNSDLKSVKGNPAYYQTTATQGVWDLMVNCRKAPFGNVAVRQALSYSLDRAQIASTAYFGYEKPVCTPFFSPVSTGYDASLVNAQAFSLSKAKQLLDSAGLHDLTINFPYPTSYPSLETLAEIWQSDLATIGVTLKIQPISAAEWGDDLLVNPQTDVLIWNNGRCLLDGAIFWSTQVNFVPGQDFALGYTDPSVPALIAQGAKETDTAKRKAIYQQLNRSVVESAHCISIVTYSNVWSWSKQVTGPSCDLISNLQLGKVSLT
jgi:peptide/nickel transport system substrate-binding protein